MLYSIIQIFLFILFLIALGLLFKNKILRFGIVFIGVLFVVLQLVSLAFNNNLINYCFYEQINVENIISVKGFFLSYIIGAVLLFVAFLFLFRYVIKKIANKQIKPLFLTGMLLVTGTLLFLPNGIGTNLYEIVDIKSTKTRSFHTALEQLGIAREEYVSNKEIEATAGKNIIVLSLESLERGYLEPPLTELTPNLGALSRKYSFIEMEPQFGASWTSASMYTVMTGVPAYFKSSGGNTIFQHTTASKIGSLGSVLQTAGYDMSYLITKQDFSGMGDMLRSFGFEVLSDDDFDQKYKETHWGIQDKDMFAELKKELLSKKDGDRPFAVFLSTVSGHFPHGVYDERMETVLPKRDSPLEFMASAVDHYIGDLFDFLEKNGLLENTEVFIFPDHQLMGTTSEVLEKFKNQRGLYVITTAKKEKVLKGIENPVLQMDLPRMIINGAGIETNATFLSSFISKDKRGYLSENRGNMLALNEASLDRNTFSDGFRLSINKKQNKAVLSALDGSFKEKLAAPSNNMFSVILFTNDLRFMSQKEIAHKDTRFPPLKTGYYMEEISNAFKTSTEYAVIYSVVGDTVHAFLKKGPYIGIMHKGVDEVVFSESDIAALNSWSTLQPGPEIKKDELFLKSTGWKSISQYGTSRIYVGLKPMPVKRGLNLLYFDDGEYKTYTTGTFANEAETKKLLELLKKLIVSKKLIALVVHDTSVKKLSNYEKELKNLGLPKLSELGYRHAYIGIFQTDGFVEKTGASSIKATIPLKIPLSPNRSIAQDTMRFIAHAGGAIHGDTYTNSLEALNSSYKKGFRLFELDIIKTSDNVFVAAHGWKQWSEKTGYSGETPVSLRIFKENPIKEYTPMDIKDINLWFRNHPDAILVTDKINDPKAFSEAFVDKERLMMELFSLKAAKKARTLGIKVLLTDNELMKLEKKGKALETLNALDIHYVAVSRKLLKDNLLFFKRLKSGEVKTYVFHLYKPFDADFVFKYELDYIYGMYVDDWGFRISGKE